MAKTAQHKTQARKQAPAVQRKQVSQQPLIPEKYQTPAFLALIFILIVIFFNEGLFGNKVFSSPDNIASGSFQTFLNDAKAKDQFPLWVPYIFGGMPSFAALVPHLERMYDISHAVWVTVRDTLYALWGKNEVWQIVLFYVIFAFGFYFLADYKFRNKLIALYCAIAAVFITPIIQMIIVGHNSKMIAVMMFPYIFLFVLKLYDLLSTWKENNDKKKIYILLLYSAALTFFIHVQMSSNHIQMLFYFFLFMGIYFLYRIIDNIRRKAEVDVILKTFAIFAAATILSGLMYSDSYLSVREYNKYSMRGVPAITNQLPGNEAKQDEQPLDYDYATNWSFSPVEVMTFFFPNWVGFGDVEYQNQPINTYWGQMPFTTSPMYFGVVTILLAVIGVIYRFKTSRLVQILTVITFLSLLLSFGRTFPIFYDILYYNLPYFSSFRAPVMIHILINVAMVLLAGYGIKSIIELVNSKDRTQKFLKSAKYVFPILALPFLIALIGFEGSYKEWVTSSSLTQKVSAQVNDPQQVSSYISQVAKIAYDNLKSEMIVVSIITLIAFGLIYLYIKGSLSYKMLLPSLILITLIDLWHIDFKTLHWNNKTDMESVFRTPDYVNWILNNDKNTNEYRIIELKGTAPQRSNTPAYWRLHNVYGYQGAKLRIYQDIDDVAGISNPNVLNIMNTKYVISDNIYTDSMFVAVFKGSKNVMINKNYLPRAHFVSEYKVAGGLEILNNIREGRFDPWKTAFFETDPGKTIEPADSTTAFANITSFDIHNIKYDVNATGNNLLVMSEVYYPAGWKAFIDGQQTEIYKTNYAFRGIFVPPGKHTVEFKFEPETYYTGKTISIAGNVLLLLVFGAAITGIVLLKRKDKKGTAEPEKSV